MADRNFNGKWTYGREKVDLDISFQPNGTGAVDNTQNKGQTQATVTRTGVGVFNVVLKDGYADLDSIAFGVRLNAAVATLVVVTGAVDVNVTKTFTITVMQESAGTFAAADIANNANAWICIKGTLANSSVVT